MGKKSKKSHKKKHKKYSGSVSKKNVDVATLYQNGLNYFQNDAYHSAVIEWKKIPDHKFTAEMTIQLAEACYRNGLQLYQQLSEGNQEKIFNQIIASLTQAINLQSNRSIYHYHLGLAYHRYGNYKKAISSYKKALEIEKNDRYLLHLILAYLKQGNVTEANNNWQLMNRRNVLLSTVISILNHQDISIANLNLKEDSIEYYFLTGLIQFKIKEFDLAIESFEKALTSRSTNKSKSIDAKLPGYIYYFLGLVEQNKNEEKAKSYWEQLLKFKFSSEQVKKNLTIFFFNEGMKLTQKGELKAAIIPLSNALKMQPHNKVITKNINLARFLYANQIAQQGKVEEAIKLWYSSPIKKEINRIHNIALALDMLKQPKEANFQWIEVINHWKKEYRSKADNSLKDYLITAHKHLAQNYLKINNEKRAIKEFENVLNFTPNDTEIRSRLGELLMENGRWNRAIKEFRTILHSNPNNIDALLNIAFIYDQSYEYDKALDTLNTILTIEPNNSQAKRKMGEIFHEQAHDEWVFGNYSEAINLFKRQIEIDPKEFGGYHCLSDLYFKIGKKRNVDNLLNDFINTDPDNPIVYIKVAQIYYEAGLKAKANNFLIRAEQLNPTDIKILVEIGKTVFDFSHQKAKKYFDRAINIAKAKAQLYYEIGHWIGTDEPRMALFYLKKYVKLEKENARALFEIGLLCGLVNDKKESLKAFIKAKQLAEQQEDEELIEILKSFKYQNVNQVDLFGDQLSLF